MKRRLFLYGFTSATCMVGGVKLPNSTYELVFKLVPKESSIRTFSSADEFLDYYGADRTVSSLNSFFLNRGWLKKIDVKLGSSGQEVIIRKVYQSEFHKKLYTKLWSLSSGGRSYEAKKYHQIKMTSNA